MVGKIIRRLTLLAVLTSFVAANSYAADTADQAKISRAIMDSIVRPLMRKHNIPGMSAAVTINGTHYFYNYGVASRKTRQPVTSKTLFEIGSLTKTFTATLASYAEVKGNLSLSDSASKYVSSLRGSHFDKILLLNLGTHTSGLPLVIPNTIKNNDQLMRYFREWQPPYAVGTRRTYSNTGIGLLGSITARSLQMSYDDAIEKILFPQLGMRHSYLTVPLAQRKNYAQGYTKEDKPIRLNSGILASEAYGVKSCSADLIWFLDANMQITKLNDPLQRAVMNTHKGYFKAGEITQGLIWEQYSYPANLQKMLAGNSPTVVYNAVPATRLNPTLPLRANVLLNKTGSTNGFSTYAAFIPSRKMGIVLLANKSYPVDQRVKAAHRILTRLEKSAGPK